MNAIQVYNFKDGMKGPFVKGLKGINVCIIFLILTEQPEVLRVLTQVEEMLIERVNPMLQVSHARDGKYKDSGHTIIFPQDISMIAKKLS